MNIYQLIDLSKMGDFDEKWGQTYWSQDDKGQNLKFNSMNEDITAPCTISAEETTSKTSSKGTPYLQLKKVKVAEKPAESVQGTIAEVEIDEQVKSNLRQKMSENVQPSPSTPLNPTQLDKIETAQDRIESELQEVNSKLDKLLYGDSDG